MTKYVVNKPRMLYYTGRSDPFLPQTFVAIYVIYISIVYICDDDVLYVDIQRTHKKTLIRKNKTLNILQNRL